MTEEEFPKTLAGYEVIDHQRVLSREGEPPLAAVLRRDPARTEALAYEVCSASLHNGEWRGFNTEHSMPLPEARRCFNRRIQERGAV